MKSEKRYFAERKLVGKKMHSPLVLSAEGSTVNAFRFRKVLSIFKKCTFESQAYPFI